MKEILKILAERVSRKAILLMTGMILVYMICLTPNVVHAVIAIIAICGLSILGVLLQFYLDVKKNNSTIPRLGESGIEDKDTKT